jgi:hypothetical protein
MAWFKGDSTHGCSGCGGKITTKTVGADKGPSVATYTHECSKCGKDSAYVCHRPQEGVRLAQQSPSGAACREAGRHRSFISEAE